MGCVQSVCAEKGKSKASMYKQDYEDEPQVEPESEKPKSIPQKKARTQVKAAGSQKADVVTEEASNTDRVHMYEAIKKNDSKRFEKYLSKVKVQENLGRKGANQTAIHVACEYNSFDLIIPLLDQLETDSPQVFKEVCNLRNDEGLTPIMLAIIFDSFEVFTILIEEGDVVDESLKSEPEGETLLEMCKVYSPDCYEYYQDYLDQKSKGADNHAKQPGESRKEHITPAKKAIKEKKKAQPSKGKKLQELLQKYEGTSDRFVDSEFPPEVDSISRNKNHKKYNEYFVNAPWKRAHEIINCAEDELQLFDGIDPNDINQGCLGVCYLLASLSACAEFPHRLEKCFNQQRGNKYGVYSVTFYLNGEPTEMIVDDNFPCYSWGKALFSSPKGNEIWVMVLEKAYCKYYKSFTQAEAGFPSDAFEYVHGCPAQYFSNDSLKEDEVWRMLSDFDERNFMMTCSSRGGLSRETTGIVSGHAYTILSAHNVNGVKLFKIRNPWGKGEWKGDYSDKSSKWTDSLKRACNHTDEEDGAFFMTVKDFMGHFSGFDVAYYHDNFVYSSIKKSFKPKQAQFFEFSTSQKTKAYFRAHFDDIRKHKPDGGKQVEDGYKYSACNMTLCKKLGDGKIERINKPHNNQHWGARSVFLHNDLILELDKGDYLLKVDVDWYDGKEHETTISAYASHEIKFKGDVKVDDFDDQLAASIGRTLTKIKYEREGMKYFDGWIGYTTYFYYIKNDNPSKEGELSITYSSMGDFIIESPHKIEGGWSVKLEPGKDAVVRMTRKDTKGKMFGGGGIRVTMH